MSERERSNCHSIPIDSPVHCQYSLDIRYTSEYDWILIVVIMKPVSVNNVVNSFNRYPF